MLNTGLSFALLGALLSPVDAFVRMSCGSRLMDERIDPIVNPGTPSSHVHAINGGNGFNFTQPDGLVKRSTCTTCPIKEDLSVYWTPKLYFHNKTDDTYTAVPQAGDDNGVRGGQTVYYLQRGGPNNDALKAFPDGFRMIAGDPFKRNATTDFAGQGISFACINYNNPGPETPGLPQKKCPQGLRAQVFFPACWDGKNLDSADHKSHMAYPIQNYNGGACPSTHPVHMISLFYEVLYSTSAFDSAWNESTDQQPYVFANGDPTGYSFHGDFLNGWDVPTLQKLTDTCTDASGVPDKCAAITLYDSTEMNSCKIPNQIAEDVYGPMKQLPGCNAIQPGPARATPPASCARTGTIGPYASYGTDLTKTKGFKFLGCAPDSASNRTFSATSTNQNTMTNEKCADYCSGKGYSYFGTEYGSECYCSNSIPADKQPVAGSPGSCTMKCAGNSTELCGGASGLSVYQKCTAGSACVNAQYQPVQ